MNLYTYKISYLGRHQDLLAEAAETRLVKLGQKKETKTGYSLPKFFEHVLPKLIYQRQRFYDERL